MARNLRTRIVDLLGDGELHSGEALAKALACTRTAVWKQISTLRSMGVEIVTERGRGYRLVRPLELLDRVALARLLDQSAAKGHYELDIYGVTDSTSERLRNSPPPRPGAMRVALAEFQTRGRGRRGRPWYSPYANGLCLSVSWQYQQVPPGLSGVSLAAGIAVVRALQRWRPASLGLKWPNDVIAEGRKLAGLLIDVEGELSGPIAIVIGLGVNLESPVKLRSQVAANSGLEPIGLNAIAQGAPVSRNELAAAIIESLFMVLTEYGRTGLTSFTEAWREYDLLYGTAVDVSQGDRSYVGVARGIGSDGSLQLSVNGETLSLVAGEVTVRPAS